MFSESPSVGFWIGELKTYLEKENYSSSCIQRYVSTSHRFLDYLAKRQLEIASASRSDVQAFLESDLVRFRRRYGRVPADPQSWRTCIQRGVDLLLGVAREDWPPKKAPVTELEILWETTVQGYGQWLSQTCALTSTTVIGRMRIARHFLACLGKRSTRGHIRCLCIEDLDAYLEERTRNLRRSSRRELAICLRSFLGYLYGQGWLNQDLAPAVILPKRYSDGNVPAALGEKEIAVLLECTACDTSPKGLRDYAILLLLVVYGLRAGEVVKLRLEDLDWRRDRIEIFHFKTGAHSVLPLLPCVGNALLEYLRRGRPKTSIREVFLRAQAPYRALCNGSSLHQVVASRLRQAGVQVQGRRGPHALRHAQALRLLRASVPLKTIGDILGHRAPSSTSAYLKLATEDLRQVGLELPNQEVAR